MRHVKIVATIGPATSSPDCLKQLLHAGVNVARFNMSHGTPDWHKTTIQRLRDIALAEKIPLAILVDLAGPKIRLGNLPTEGTILQKGRDIILLAKSDQHSRHSESGDTLPVNLSHFPDRMESGQIVLIDDGNISLTLEKQETNRLICRVVVGGKVTSHKGVNFPGLQLDIPGFTEKDANDLQVAIDVQADYVALSFVRSPQDIHTLQTALGDRSAVIPIIAKIERPEALTCLENILDVADGVMVARGDLALEISPEEVPLRQKQIIAQANRMGKPVITATQMLESMTRNSSPTRAEASDVANAVLDGTDAVMLSAETSTGNFPLESVQVMDRIIRQTEKEMFRRIQPSDSAKKSVRSTPEAVCEAAVSLATSIGAQAIVVFTDSGHTAMLLARHRPTVKIIALTPSPTVTRQLILVWGIVSCVFPQIDATDERINTAQDHLKTLGLLHEGRLIVIVTGERLGHSLGTNIIKAHLVV
ncbi:MAG: pyruvate kinase [Nitrospirales bacterium]|nr:MAG: pyruvate kinase [Nitrospirales bacterium]